MKEFILIIKKVLGKSKYEELFDYTMKLILDKFGKIRSDKAIDIANINFQVILIISIEKAKGCSNEEILKILHWKNKKSYKYIVANSIDEFISLYDEYIKLIIE